MTDLEVNTYACDLETCSPYFGLIILSNHHDKFLILQESRYSIMEAPSASVERLSTVSWHVPSAMHIAMICSSYNTATKSSGRMSFSIFIALLHGSHPCQASSKSNICNPARRTPPAWQRAAIWAIRRPVISKRLAAPISPLVGSTCAWRIEAITWAS